MTDGLVLMGQGGVRVWVEPSRVTFMKEAGYVLIEVDKGKVKAEELAEEPAEEPAEETPPAPKTRGGRR